MPVRGPLLCSRLPMGTLLPKLHTQGCSGGATLTRYVSGCAATRVKVCRVCWCGKEEDANPLFPPQLPSKAAATSAMLNLLRREPGLFGHERSRWTLHTLLSSCNEVGLIPKERLHSLPGLHQLLERLGISYKRARSHVYSPDPFYLDKQAAVERLVADAGASGGKKVLVYMDQVTTYRQPTLAQAYEHKGHTQPLAERSYHSDTPTRIVATMEHFSGQSVYLRASRIGVSQLVQFYQKLREAYPD